MLTSGLVCFPLEREVTEMADIVGGADIVASADRGREGKARSWSRLAMTPALAIGAWLGQLATAFAEEPAKAPDLATRVADLEAYITNGAPKALNSAGPGHNAWMMTSALLVLFMTLPGLALFYGGLVRRKNVLSVLAQCLGIAGLVTILWWVVGYSLVFAPGCPFFGSPQFAFLRGRSEE